MIHYCYYYYYYYNNNYYYYYKYYYSLSEADMHMVIHFSSVRVLHYDDYEEGCAVT